MKNLWNKLKEALREVNFDGLCCTIKGDPSIWEIKGALKRQDEINNR